ncbi:NADH-quinone oxidoreductase subunit C [Planctomicrobium piriforme]|uniref:NADH-quinone oxidoreductase subunit C n=1 Tax=Planctomicrobium piriforme TaxID=1576369 RepID=A0A1I3I8U3_9PLAN|nr:NADH-quinone oxidoreductase subunit C [Planctomicrobium piriforme]SFI44425.1 NADH-quinone oxidoreductase subunit C [Planctomicrobium piriforme]
MTAQDIHQKLLAEFGGDVILAFKADVKDPWIEIAPPAIPRVCDFLRTAPGLQFDMLCNLCGVDYFEPDAKLAAKFPYQPHVEVVYHLRSLKLQHRIVLKVKVPRWLQNEPGRLPEVPTVSNVWGSANWHEREAFDLVGIHFVGHPNLVRILCADDWVGHPLRKDYEMPLEYHGVRGR